MRSIKLFFFFLLISAFASSQEMKYIPAEIDFSEKLYDWDGFGFNYVETAQTRDYNEYKQDYGGFSLLNENQKKEIVNLVFGEDGLQVQIVKMFLDPYHQQEPGSKFDHEITTKNMREFVRNGVDLTRKRGDEINIITTLYGPPAWATQQKIVGGRDLDKSQTKNLCTYMADWVKYLKDNDYPVKYFSLHNEGEDFYRWNFEEGTQRLDGFDFNMYWPPDQVNDFLKELPKTFKEYKLKDIKVTNGEPSNWTRFYYWGYARGLYEDDEALNNLGLITTHGFIGGDMGKLSYGISSDLTNGLIREKKPELHSWVTSFSWGKMGVDFVRMVHENMYSAKINGIIPWAGIQNPSQWVDGDPNPGTAIVVNDDGTYKVQNGYYFYKQLTRAGYRGMAVVNAVMPSPQAFIIAFSSNGTKHPDSFVVTSNIFLWGLPMELKIKGTQSRKFKAFRTSEDGNEKFKEIGVFEVKNGSIIYDPPKGTTTTFIAID